MRSHPSGDLVIQVSQIDHSIWPDDSLVTVVEYGDFECPNCKRAAPAVKLLLQTFSDDLRFVYRHCPLEEVHSHALAAAEASECAAAQSKFWMMHDVLFENQLHLNKNNLSDYAEIIQFDMTRYTTDMVDHVHLQRIREQIESGRKAGIRGAPWFFVNEKFQDVSFGLNHLFEAVQSHLDIDVNQRPTTDVLNSLILCRPFVALRTLNNLR